MSGPRLADPATLYCAFCGKSQHEVGKLIAGPSTLICNECVALCVDIIEGSPVQPPAPELYRLAELRLRCIDIALRTRPGGLRSDILVDAEHIERFLLGRKVEANRTESQPPLSESEVADIARADQLRREYLGEARDAD